jgi:hypothetical protein
MAGEVAWPEFRGPIMSRSACGLAVLGCFAWQALAWGQAGSPAAGTPATPPAGTSSLGVRQQRVERMMEDLERKFRSLRQSLEQTEPDRAKRLEETYNKAKELLIQQRMGDITKLLDQARLDTATDGQRAILTDIRTLLELLLNEKSDKDKAREEFERLSEWKKQIENILSQEKGEKLESDKVANKDKTQADLQAKIQALEKAIAEQKGVIAATESARTEGIQGLGKIAGQQSDVRQKAEDIANQIAKEAGDEKGPFEAETPPSEGAAPADGNKPGEGKPGEGKPGEGKPGEGKPGEGKPGEGKPGEGKPGEGKPGEGKPGEGKPGEGKPGEGQSGEGQPSEAAPPKENIRPSEPGVKPLRQAVENQKSAEANLLEG